MLYAKMPTLSAWRDSEVARGTFSVRLRSPKLEPEGTCRGEHADESERLHMGFGGWCVLTLTATVL